jgi:hypothetical protein
MRMLFCYLLVLVAGFAQTDPLANANGLLSASKFAEAEAAFREAVQGDSNNANAWYGLGAALQEQGKAADALQALAKATGVMPARVAFREARAHAQLGDLGAAFAALDRAVAGGFAQVQTLETTAEFKQLRTDPRYPKLLQNIDARVRPCMHDPKYREFDFWVGEWDVRPTGQPAAPPSRSKISKDLQGCVVFEDYTAVGGGYWGKSFNIYDRASKRWSQRYVDSSGALLHFDGEVRDGNLYYTGENFNPQGQKVQDKLTFFKLPNGHVRQVWEQSADQGKTWTTIFDGDYSPRK